MPNNNKLKKIILATAIATTPIISFAAGFQVNELSPRLQGQALAGSGSDVGDITGIFYNPALLGTIKQDQAYFGASYINPHIEMKNASAVNTATQSTGFGPSTTVTQVTGSPSQKNVADSVIAPNLYFGKILSSQWTVGMAITAPWGLPTNYNSDSVVRYMAQKTNFLTVNLNPELAFKLNSHWTFGAGFQAQYADVEFSEFDGTANAALAASQPTDLKGGGWGYGYNLGILFSPNDSTHLGLSYRSQIDYTLHGHGDQYVTLGPIQPPIFNPTDPYNAHTSVSATMNTPAVLNFSASHKFNDKWQINTTEQLTYWSSLQKISISMPDAYQKSQTVPLNWHNSMLYSIGGDYFLNKRWTLRAGVAVDQTPTNDTNRDARIPDTTRYWLTTGASYHLGKRLIVDAAYERIFMKPQSIDSSKVSDATVDGVPAEVDNIKADYTGSANIFALGVNWLF